MDEQTSRARFWWLVGVACLLMMLSVNDFVATSRAMDMGVPLVLEEAWVISALAASVLMAVAVGLRMRGARRGSASPGDAKGDE